MEAPKTGEVVDLTAVRAERAEASPNPEIEALQDQVAAFREILMTHDGAVLSGERAQAAEATALALTIAEQELELAKLKASVANDNKAPVEAAA